MSFRFATVSHCPGKGGNIRQILCYLKNLGSPQLSLNANNSDPSTIAALPSLVFLVCVLLEVGHL
jgi:hypothetical protein